MKQDPGTPVVPVSHIKETIKIDTEEKVQLQETQAND
jgi:hypothetical protein